MKDRFFLVEVESLRQGKIVLDVDQPPGSLDLNVEGFHFEGRVTGRLVYMMSGSDILIHGALRARAVGQCVRCLAPAPCDVRADVGLAFLPGTAGVEEPLDEEGESAIVDYYAGDFLDPAEQLRDLLLLELPALPVCHADCRGLCPQCGANLNRETCSCRKPDDPESEKDAWKANLRGLRLSE